MLKSRFACRLFMRYMKERLNYESDLAFQVASCKDAFEVRCILIDLDKVADVLFLMDICNYTFKDSGFECIDKRIKEEKGA